MRVSCGALLYARRDDEIGIILGDENRFDGFLPFKGKPEKNETYEEAAIREIYEETCGIVKVDKVSLDHRFSSKSKHYYIGICEVPYETVHIFNRKRANETRESFKEKKTLKFFPLKNVLYCREVHPIAKASIKYYWNRIASARQMMRESLRHTENYTENYTENRYRCAVDVDFAQKQFEDVFMPRVNLKQI